MPARERAVCRKLGEICRKHLPEAARLRRLADALRRFYETPADSLWEQEQRVIALTTTIDRLFMETLPEGSQLRSYALPAISSWRKTYRLPSR
jgi:hypothetical protein